MKNLSEIELKEEIERIADSNGFDVCKVRQLFCDLKIEHYNQLEVINLFQAISEDEKSELKAISKYLKKAHEKWLALDNSPARHVAKHSYFLNKFIHSLRREQLIKNDGASISDMVLGNKPKLEIQTSTENGYIQFSAIEDNIENGIKDLFAIFDSASSVDLRGFNGGHTTKKEKEKKVLHEERLSPEGMHHIAEKVKRFWEESKQQEFKCKFSYSSELDDNGEEKAGRVYSDNDAAHFLEDMVYLADDRYDIIHCNTAYRRL